MSYFSVTHISSNEAGEEQVEIVYNNGFIRDLFKKPLRKEIYVGSGTVWYDKKLCRRARTSKECEVINIVKWCQYNKLEGE
mgnify:CR=1 FL=1